MNIYITLDYELFFGDASGDYNSCMLEPTNRLLELCNDHGVKLSFFVDAGYLLGLKRFGKQHPRLLEAYNAIASQLRNLSLEKHDIQLHIHPHWEDTYYHNNQWVFNFSRYKLADFDEAEINRIIREYKEELESISQREVFAYRAGGWCLQPFEKLGNSLYRNGILVDSTVFSNGYNSSNTHFFDFRNAPDDTTIWRFDNDPIVELKSGRFIELPIASKKVSPVFFWRMMYIKLLGDRKLHSAFGKGRPIKNSKKQLFRLLTTYTNSVVSIDGFKAFYLESAFVEYLKKFEGNSRDENFVIIGHPKSLTNYSLCKIEAFIKGRKYEHRFTTYSNEIDKIRKV